MMYRRFSIACLATSLVFGAAATMAPPSSGAAQSQSLNGTWRLVGEHAATQAGIQQQAIEPALATLTPDIQRLARARIAETTWVPVTIVVNASPERIAVTFQGAENRTFSTASGQAENVYSRSGVRAQLTQTLRPDGGIEQRLVALDGTQINSLIPDASGRMHLDVHMESPRIPTPIRFRLTYQRAQ